MKKNPLGHSASFTPEESREHQEAANVELRQKILSATQSFSYPHSKVLKNKHQIKESDILKKKCSENAALEMEKLRHEPLPERVDSEYLKYIHKRLFQSTFEWAGHTRGKPFTFKDGSVAYSPIIKRKEFKTAFAASKNVEEGLKKLDEALAEKNYLQGLSREEFAKHAAELMIDLHYLHPFREGNRRACRVFMEKLAESAGHSLDFSLVPQKRKLFVNVQAMDNGNPEPMRHLFEDISNPEKLLVLNEFTTEMRELGLGENNYRLAVAAKDGVTYQGTYRGSGANGFMIDVKGTFVVGNKKHLSPEQLKTLKIGDQISFTAPRAQDLQQTLIPEEKIKPLTEHELAERIRNNREVQESMKAIKVLSKVVYGNEHVVQSKMPKIKIPVTERNMSEARQFGLKVRDFPQSVHRLRGFSLCGLKTGARQHAKENVVPLSLAIMGYCRVIEHAQKDILEEHQREQERCAKSIQMPSVAIRNLFSLSREQREAVLSGSPELREEVRTYTTKLEERLSPQELIAIKEDSPYRLANSIGTSESNAKEIREIFLKMKGLRQDLHQMHLSFQDLHQKFVPDTPQLTKEQTKTVSPSAVKATKVTTVLEQQKALEQNVRLRGKSESVIVNLHQPTKEQTKTVSPSAVKATKVTTVLETQKALEQNVRPPKVQRQRAMTV